MLSQIISGNTLLAFTRERSLEEQHTEGGMVAPVDARAKHWSGTAVICRVALAMAVTVVCSACVPLSERWPPPGGQPTGPSLGGGVR